MFKLLVILFIIKLYARNDIFKLNNFSFYMLFYWICNFEQVFSKILKFQYSP